MAKKKNIVIANWKMNPSSLEEAKNIFNFTKKAAVLLKNTDVLVFPPFPYLHPLLKLKSPRNLFLGAQNVSSEERGAFTGEVSASMLKNLGVKYVLVGHSERRAMGEDNKLINKKLQIVFESGLTPILCIGESLRDRDGTHLEFLKNQIKDSISGLQKKHMVGMIIAYEPVWAIGKSYREAMNPTDIHETVLFIKKSIGEFFGKDIASSVRILYGAAVESQNAKSVIEYGNVEGFLVGHASLKKEEFPEILKSIDTK